MIPKNEPENLARRATRRMKIREEKAVLATAEEQRRLRRAIWTAPLVDLEKPYQRGWYREFELTKEARRRDDATQLEDLLCYVNKVHCCRTGKFLKYDREKKRDVPRPHSLRRFSWKELKEADFPQHLYRYLSREGTYEPLSFKWLKERDFRCTAKFVVRQPQYFTSVTKPLIITQRRVDMPQVRARVQEIENRFDQTNGWGRYRRLKGYSWRRFEFCPAPWQRREEVVKNEVTREHDPCRALSWAVASPQ
ncbi:MAG: hypothetical protein AAF733_10990 [Verrucomicrobiota bacterium]